MDVSPQFVSQLRRERIARARRMSSEQKLAAGPQLFSLALECMRAGIQLQNPAADDALIKSTIHQRVLRMRRKDAEAVHGTT